MLLVTEKCAGRKRNRPLKDYAGQRFNSLVAIGLVRRDAKGNEHAWRFRCDCGAEAVKSIKSVRSGHTKSCGCLHRRALVERNTTHGLCRRHPRTYRTWKDMRARCSNAGHKDFKDYGGRGISVCPEWDDFAQFFADMGERPEGKTIDRIDVDGGYSPDNCRWADATEQARNKRTNHLVTIGSETKTLQEWCLIYGVDHSKAQYRIRAGISPEQAFSHEDFRIVSPEDRHGGGI